MYYFVERSIAVIKPKQPFLDWVNKSFPDMNQRLTLDSIRIDCNSYLIPEVEEIEDGINFVDEKYLDLFALELASWTEEQDTWPQELTLQMFWDWFDVEIYPSTIDLCDDEDMKPANLVEDTLH